MSANKYYVVWNGFDTGVFDSWEDTEPLVSGYPDAKYRAFKNYEEAVQAFRDGYDQVGLLNEVNKQMEKAEKKGHKIEWKEDPTPKEQKLPKPLHKDVIRQALAVDGACEGNPGIGEYRGVFVETGEQMFHFGPIKNATNNIMEFLAIVHGLAFLEKQNIRIPIYSDSVSAISWVRQNKCKTTISFEDTDDELFRLINNAEKWLNTHGFRVSIIKWNTKEWGEIPADFGRK